MNFKNWNHNIDDIKKILVVLCWAKSELCQAHFRFLRSFYWGPYIVCCYNRTFIADYYDLWLLLSSMLQKYLLFLFSSVLVSWVGECGFIWLWRLNNDERTWVFHHNFLLHRNASTEHLVLLETCLNRIKGD